MIRTTQVKEGDLIKSEVNVIVRVARSHSTSAPNASEIKRRGARVLPSTMVGGYIEF